MSQTTLTSRNYDRSLRVWLWLGWVLIATASVCLGLTLSSMTTVYEMTTDSSGLAQGISGSLRYMIVGLPALFVGIIILIVTYIRRRQ
jgi:hypothetical protein